MLEKELYNGVLTGARRDGILLVRIVDGSVGRKPADFLGINRDGRAVIVEVKKVEKGKQPTTLPNLFEVQQIEYLRRYALWGGISFALIYYVPNRTMMVYDFSKEEYVGTLKKEKEGWVGWKECVPSREGIVQRIDG